MACCGVRYHTRRGKLTCRRLAGHVGAHAQRLAIRELQRLYVGRR